LAVVSNISVLEDAAAISLVPGQLYGWNIFNSSAAIRYVKLYDALALGIDPATSVPKLVIGIPAVSSVSMELACGIEFLTAISYRGTQLIADTDDTAPAANDIVANFFYF
jgi:hypothetical protein